MSEKVFLCPRCGGSHFSTYFQPPEYEEAVERVCGDEYARGCHWRGPDSECMVESCPHCDGTGLLKHEELKASTPMSGVCPNV